MNYHLIIDSPIDPLLLTGNGEELTGLYMNPPQRVANLSANSRQNAACFSEVVAQLRAYFAGELQTFDLPLNATGSGFQKRVWEALIEIPYGETVSYKAIAERIHSPKAVRAVGLANGRNPLSIVVPCHRVIGANGKLTGYGGGLPRKQWLLAHEAQQSSLLV